MPVLAADGFSNFSLDDAVRSGLTHFRLGDDVALRARFHKDVVEKLEELPLAPDQVIARRDETWFELRATVAHTRALHAFLVGYGPYCVVEAPSVLRDAIRDDLRRAAEQYA